MARVDSFDHVVEIDVDVDLDVDNSNIEMNNSDNSSQSPPTSSEFSDPSVSGYQLEQNYFSSDDSDNDFYEIETDSNEEELPTYPLTNFEMTIFQNNMPHLLMHDIDDELNEWEYETIDSGPLVLFCPNPAATLLIYMVNQKYFSIPFLMKGFGKF